MKTLTITEEQMNTAFLLFVVATKEEARIARASTLGGDSEPAKMSEKELSQCGARRLWGLLEAIAPNEVGTGACGATGQAVPGTEASRTGLFGRIAALSDQTRHAFDPARSAAP